MADQNLKIRIQAIDTTQRIFKAVASRLNSLRKTVFSFRTALVSLAGAGGFGFLIKSSMDSIDKISKLSRTLGISVADLRKLEFAADLSGLSIDTVARAVRNLNRVMVDFQGGTGDAKDAFDELGITSDDINAVMGDQFKVLELLADRFERVENSAVRSSIAQDLFGGRASEMLLVLEEGADGLAQISDEAERFGLLLSASAAKGVEDANDSFTRLFALFKGLRDTVVSFLAPAIQMAVESAQKYIEELIKSYDGAGGIKAFARDISLALVNAIQTFGETMAFIINLLVGAINTLINAINFITESILGTTMSQETFNDTISMSRKQISGLRDDIKQIDPSLKNLMTRFDELTSAEEYNINAGRQLQRDLRDTIELYRDVSGVTTENKLAITSLFNRVEELNNAYQLLGTSLKTVPYLPDDFEIQFTHIRDAIKGAYEAGEDLNDVMNTGTDNSYEFGTGLKELAKNARNFGKNMEDVVIRGIQSFEDALVSAVTGTMKLKDAFKQMAASIISDIIRMTIRMQISAPIAEFLAGAMPFGSTGGTSKTGAKAMGGSVAAGKPYMVGEKGAELFIPGGSGTIIPSNQLGGGGAVVHQTINISTGVSQTVRAEIMNLMPQIAEGTKAAVLDARRRGGTFASAFS
jgi:hypothetical protein